MVSVQYVLKHGIFSLWQNPDGTIFPDLRFIKWFVSEAVDLLYYCITSVSTFNDHNALL